MFQRIKNRLDELEWTSGMTRTRCSKVEMDVLAIRKDLTAIMTHLNLEFHKPSCERIIREKIDE